MTSELRAALWIRRERDGKKTKIIRGIGYGTFRNYLCQNYSSLDKCGVSRGENT